MVSDWLGSVTTGVVGVVGIVSTYLIPRAARRDDKQRRLEIAQAAKLDGKIEFFTELVSQARRVQRASKVWSRSPSSATHKSFVDALDEFSILVARARITEVPDVYNAALNVDTTYRRHSESSDPTLTFSNGQFQLEPLLVVLRADMERGGQ